MINKYLTIFLLLFFFHPGAEAQHFSQFKRGVNPFFSTYFDSTFTHKRSGKFVETSAAFKQTSILENGIIVYQETYYIPPPPLQEQTIPVYADNPVWLKNYVYQRFSKKDLRPDSLISMMSQYSASGTVIEKKVWFYNQDHRRCVRIEKFNEAGIITERHFYAYLSYEESGQKNHLYKEENSDYDGFVNLMVPIYSVTRFYPNGKPMDETPYRFIPTFDHYNEHTRINGIQRTWREDGTLLREVNYQNGKLNDTTRYYHPNGNMEAIHIFDNNDYVNRWLGWNAQGKIIYERTYFGTPETRSFPNEKRWSDSGQLLFSREMSDSLNGIEKEFSESGQLLSRREIKSGTRNARFEQWSESGQLLTLQTEPKFCKDTLSAKWDEHGQLRELITQQKKQDTLCYRQKFWKKNILIEDTYSETIRMELFLSGKKYFENGNPKEMIIRQVGPKQRREFLKTWKESGATILEQTLQDGELDSNYLSWHPNGRPHIIAHYNNGIRDGQYAHYDSTGNLLFSNSYLNGVPQQSAFMAPQKPSAIYISQSLHDSISELARMVTINLLQTGQHPFLRNNQQLFITSPQIDSLALPLERAFRFFLQSKMSLPLAWKKCEYDFRLSNAFFGLEKEEQAELLLRLQKKCDNLNLVISPDEFVLAHVLKTKKITISNSEIIHIGTLKKLLENENFVHIDWQQKANSVFLYPKPKSSFLDIFITIPGDLGNQAQIRIYPDGGAEFLNHVMPVYTPHFFQE